MRKTLQVLAFVPCTFCRMIWDGGAAAVNAAKIEWRGLVRLLRS